MYNAIYSPIHQLSGVDISKDEIPTDKGFLTRKLISDVNIIEDETTPSAERPYTGEWDIVSKLRGKTYPSSHIQHGLQQPSDLVVEGET
jgi:nitrogenase molybdenum-iron protein alpha chain